MSTQNGVTDHTRSQLDATIARTVASSLTSYGRHVVQVIGVSCHTCSGDRSMAVLASQFSVPRVLNNRGNYVTDVLRLGVR
jgi:hypothetical protein